MNLLSDSTYMICKNLHDLTKDPCAVVRCQDIKTADWSENVAPFWPAVIQSALTWKGLTSLLRSGMLFSPFFLCTALHITCNKMNRFIWLHIFLADLHFNSEFLLSWFEGWKTIKGALVMPLMIQGYKKGLIKFTIITCRKPQTA